MIRVFDVFCKLKNCFKSVAILYSEAMKTINIHNHACPFCKTNKPGWKQHAKYDRYLISYCEKGVLYESIVVIRYRCSSCNHTHAILPELIVPYNTYSLVFILYVMKDYYSGSYTVTAVCDKYKIAVSTLYKWKELYLKQKKLWLGVIEDSIVNPLNFIQTFLEEKKLHELRNFFDLTGVSFIQYMECKSKLNSG